MAFGWAMWPAALGMATAVTGAVAGGRVWLLAVAGSVLVFLAWVIGSEARTRRLVLLVRALAGGGRRGRTATRRAGADGRD